MVDSDQWIFMREGCQWSSPEQDPYYGPLTMCGNTVKSGCSYCEEHYNRVFTTTVSVTEEQQEPVDLVLTIE